MASESKSRLVWGLLFAVFWVGLLGFSYWYFLVKPQQWFDPEMVQPPVLADAENQQQLRQLLSKHFPKLDFNKNWFVRFQQPGCGCERFVELYHKSFAQQAGKDMQVISVDLTSPQYSEQEKHSLLAWVPATPAVIVFQAKGEALYFGPYHQEGICNAENSYLEPVLQSLKEGNPISVMNTLVFGCFCATNASPPDN